MEFGLIGLGFISKKHIEAIYKIKGEVIAICDTTLSKFRGFKQTENYENYLDLLDNKNVKIVSIATPNFLHPQMAIDALDRNKIVVLEKPLGISTETVQELLSHKLADKVAVCYQRRFDEDCQRIKNSAKKIIKIDAHIFVRRDPDYWNTWRSDTSQSGGGNLINIDIHFLDLIQWWLGGIPAKVTFAKLAYRQGIDQFVLAELDFNGVPVKFCGSSLHNERTIYMKVYYEDGTFDIYNKETATHFDVYDQFINHNNYTSVKEAVKSLQIVQDIYKFDKENA